MIKGIIINERKNYAVGGNFAKLLEGGLAEPKTAKGGGRKSLIHILGRG